MGKFFTFKKMLFFMTLVLLGIITSLLFILNDFLVIYQKNLPETLMSEAKNAFENRDFAYFDEYIVNTPQLDILNAENFYNYVGEGKIYTEKGFLNEGFLMNVYCDTRKIATVTYYLKEEKDEFNIAQFMLKKVELNPKINTEIEVIGKTQVYVNDVLLDKKYAVDTGSVEQFERADIKPPIWDNKYILPTTLNKPKITAGKNSEYYYTIQEDYSGNSIKYTLICHPDSNSRRELEDFVVDFMKDYTTFSMKRGTLHETVLPYLYPDTPFVDKVNEYSNKYGQKYENEEFSDIKIDNFIRYDDDKFFCEFEMIYSIFSPYSEKPRNFPVKADLYIIEVDNEKKILEVEFKS